MTFIVSKKLVALVTISTVCFGSTAHAADAFNKFPQQQATATQTQTQTQTQRVVVRSEAILTQSRVQTYTQTSRINRVVEPVQARVVTPSIVQEPTVEFNKMQSQTTASREMPVLNRHLVASR
jgi:adenine deaminase